MPSTTPGARTGTGSGAGAGAAALALLLLTGAAAQEVLPSLSLSFNLSVPLGSVMSTASLWDVTYTNAEAVGPANGNANATAAADAGNSTAAANVSAAALHGPLGSGVGAGRQQLRWTHRWDGDGAFGEAKVTIEGLVTAVWVFGDLGHGAAPANVSFWETDGRLIGNDLPPPTERGLIGKLDKLEPWRTSMGGPYDQVHTYNYLQCFLDGNWTERPEHPVIDEILITTAIESNV